MRSSIACVRCRRSKVKCVNTGPNTTCRACEASNRDCSYPNPAPPGTPRNAAASNSSAGGVTMSTGSFMGGERGISGANGGASERTEVRAVAAGMAEEAKARAPVLTSPKQAPKKSKVKKPAPAGGAGTGAVSHTGPKAYREALDAMIFTPTLWIQIFETFQLHYMPTLPFLHPPTFRARLRTISNSGSAGSTSSSSTTPPVPDDGYSQLLLLGLLALTARHIPALVSHHSPGLASPAAVSDFYASALKYRLQNEENSTITDPSLEKVQAILMLAVHEWGTCRGSQAYVWLGLAIRMAGVLGLSWEDDEEEIAWPHLYAPSSVGSDTSTGKDREESNAKRRKIEQPRASSGSDKSHIEKEIRRRTFWGLFMMDRKLSAGRYRPSAISIEEAKRVQLPCGETAFLFGERAMTGYLGDVEERRNRQNGDEGDRREVGKEESILARVVRITEIWGRVQQWACTGGRRMEKYPPWNPKSTFYSLSRALEDFYAMLPQHLHFSPGNLNAHFSSRTAGAYSVMHITYFLCVVVLHREYIPFLPLRINKPQGPIYAPMFNSENKEGLENMSVAEWWDDSAKEIFKSARGIMQIVGSLEDWNSLVETPEVGFAVYLVGVTGIYAWTYPWMDQAGYITGRIHPSTQDEDENMEDEKQEAMGTGKDAARAVELVTRMKEKWKMADGFYNTLARLKKYFWRARSEYRILGDELETEEGRFREKTAGRMGGDPLHNSEEWRIIDKIFRDTDDTMTPPSSGQQVLSVHGKEPEVKREGDVETLLLAAEGVTAGSSAAGDTWTAVNIPRQQPLAQTPGAAQGTNQLASLASYASAQTPMPHGPSSFSSSQSQAQSQLSPPLSASGNSPMRPGSVFVSMSAPRTTADSEQRRMEDERRRAEDRRTLVKELELAERVAGADDLAVFASGSSLDDWAGGFHDGWMGKVWGSRID